MTEVKYENKWHTMFISSINSFFLHNKGISRTISEKSSVESINPNTFNWVDRRGCYRFSSTNTETIKTLQNAISSCST